MTVFQQAGASVQLQRRPLTKDLVLKNNVTALNERRMERRILEGVAAAEQYRMWSEGDSKFTLGDKTLNGASAHILCSWIWVMSRGLLPSSSIGPSVSRDVKRRGRRRWGSNLNSSPVPPSHVTWLQSWRDTYCEQRIVGDGGWGTLILYIQKQVVSLKKGFNCSQEENLWWHLISTQVYQQKLLLTFIKMISAPIPGFIKLPETKSYF